MSKLDSGVLDSVTVGAMEENNVLSTGDFNKARGKSAGTYCPRDLL